MFVLGLLPDTRVPDTVNSTNSEPLRNAENITQSYFLVPSIFVPTCQCTKMDVLDVRLKEIF